MNDTQAYAALLESTVFYCQSDNPTNSSSKLSSGDLREYTKGCLRLYVKAFCFFYDITSIIFDRGNGWQIRQIEFVRGSDETVFPFWVKVTLPSLVVAGRISVCTTGGTALAVDFWFAIQSRETVGDEVRWFHSVTVADWLNAAAERVLV